MKIAYLFLVHEYSQVLQRSIEWLSYDRSEFFIHVDAKAKVEQFRHLEKGNVHFCNNRVPVYWGEFSQVEAILTLMREALTYSSSFEYLVLMSGSDLPLQPARYIHDFLNTNAGTEFMTLVRVPGPGKPLSRLNTIRHPTQQPLRRFAFRTLAKLGLARRDYYKHVAALKPFAGSTWWTLSSAACNYILDFYEREYALAAFLRTSFAADEAYFPTILGNSPFKERMRRNLLFEDWSGGGAHPAMISPNHLAQFEGSDRVVDVDGNELLFARKFSDATIGLVSRLLSSREQPGAVAC